MRQKKNATTGRSVMTFASKKKMPLPSIDNDNSPNYKITRQAVSAANELIKSEAISPHKEKFYSCRDYNTQLCVSSHAARPTKKGPPT
jgi:hypothetical protein